VKLTRSPFVSQTEQAVALQCASLLLAYPDATPYVQLPLLRPVAYRLPAEAARALLDMVEHLEVTPQHEAERAYVDTFDLRRRCCLFLSYYAYRDTRKRGMAPLRFTHAYRAAGQVLSPNKLPDHLSVVCEFAATADRTSGLRLLDDRRALSALGAHAAAGHRQDPRRSV